jgi:hypothetical protein
VRLLIRSRYRLARRGCAVLNEVTDAEIDARVKQMTARLECFHEREVCWMLRVRREGLVRLRNAGRAPPSVLVGQVMLFPVAEFHGWVRANLGNVHPKSRKRREGPA